MEDTVRIIGRAADALVALVEAAEARRAAGPGLTPKETNEIIVCARRLVAADDAMLAYVKGQARAQFNHARRPLPGDGTMTL